MRPRSTLLPLLLFTALFVGTGMAHSAETRLWELAGFAELDNGEFNQTALSSLGEVSLGHKPVKLDLTDVGLVWSSVRAGDGKIYLGTGYDGFIYRVDGNKVAKIATTGALVITALAMDKKGDLFAASLSGGVVWKIPAPAKIEAGAPVEAKKWCAIPEKNTQIWSLAFDKSFKTLYAGTGPRGEIFAISPGGKANVYLDTDDKHILSLLTDGDRLLAGTSPSALLLSVRGPGRSTTLADFDATEVKALATHKEMGTIVAVNKFAIPPAIPKKGPVLGVKAPVKSKAPTPGDGQIYRLLPGGGFEQIWARKKYHVTSLAASTADRVYAGLGDGGRVISINADRENRMELDLDERQILTVQANDTLSFVGTGDAGSVYRIGAPNGADATYLSIPLDAKATARFGKIKWNARGNLTLHVRSGNTVKPDTTWSAWSGPIKNGAMATAPKARYFQVKFSFAADKKAVLISSELAYRADNRRPVIQSFNPGSRFGSTTNSPIIKAKKIAKVSARTVEAKPSKNNTATLSLSWKVENPDKDDLRYRLYYRAVGKTQWRPILKDDEVLTKTKYTWNTETVPEGNYQIKLTVDDSPSNGAGTALADEFFSVPVLVDNHDPRVSDLKFTRGRIQGTAKDSFSEISALDFSIDGGPWLPASCTDGIFDSTVEKFDFELPGSLPAGLHSVGVRAYDRAGNMGVLELHLEKK